MSLRAMSQIIEHAPDDWPPTLRFVAIIVADHINEDGMCWPSVRRLSVKTGLSVRQIQRTLNQLELCEVITRSASYQNGRQTSNVYYWNHTISLWKTCAETWAQPVDNNEGGVTWMSPPHDAHVTLGGDIRDTLGGDMDVTPYNQL